MLVTREVFQLLSGWLKGPCRGSQAGHTVCGASHRGRQRREAASDRGVHAACGGESTEYENMSFMSVTLEVSQPEMSALKLLKR